MVKNKRPPLGPSPLAASPSSPAAVGSPDPERSRVDPAFMRAMDRNRQSLERRQQLDKLSAIGGIGGGGRVRTYSEGTLYR
jgi:hypothetical protein